jgi:DNA polymerase-3 subunit gamma/tau
VLKGQPRQVPVADEEISENDLVDKAAPVPPEKIEVTGEMIQKAWKAYAASIEKSHPRIYTTLSQQVPRLTEKGIIRISLATEAQRENFIHRIKPELIRYFQRTIADVPYVFETDLIDSETTVKKVYTDQDKLDYLISKNPDLEKMKTKFNLDFDS